MDGLGDEESVLARMRTLSEKFERGDRTVVSSGELERWIEEVANGRGQSRCWFVYPPSLPPRREKNPSREFGPM